MAIRVLIERCSLPLTVSIESAGESTPEPTDLEIIDSPCHPVTHVVILDVGGSLRVRYGLEFFSTGIVDLTVLHLADMNRLLLGGKRQSCVIDLVTDEVEHEFEHCLFWGFDDTSLPGYVLETGELDCALRGRDGRILSTCNVDPPWDMHLEENRVRFESMTMGTSFLEVPNGR